MRKIETAIPRLISTAVNAYRFDISDPTQKVAWEELSAKLKPGPYRMKSLSMRGEGKNYYQTGQALDGQTVTLESTHLFDNQWNSAPIEGFSELGYRLFDWAQDALFDHRGNENKIIKQGYYLDQTDEMREVRRNTDACGHCGKQEPAAKGYVFCPHCLDSAFLKEADLPLLRMRPIDTRFGVERAPLTEAEAAYLLPLYKTAQLNGTGERSLKALAKFRTDVEARYVKTIENAANKRAGFLWMLEKGLGLELIGNCIYYDHTQTFSFGWRSALDEVQTSIIIDVISEFPFAYEIKTAAVA